MNETEKKMAAMVLLFEDDRATGAESLCVRKLPAADTGGKFEICGICDGIEPAVFAAIKALLDAGRKVEAWDACLQYVWDNTKAVVGWIGSAEHPGIEFFLRDHYFNSGSRNTGRILQRALCNDGFPVDVDGVVGAGSRKALADRLARGGDLLFLDHLRKEREAFYRSCKQFTIFGKGWLNRSQKAFDFARMLSA